MAIALQKQLTLPSSFRMLADNILRNPGLMNERDFAQELTTVQKAYMKTAIQRDSFCHAADKLADKLLAADKPDFAGIIISKLCKLCEFIPSKLEKFATKGYEIAKQNGDYLHMMARLNNLRKIYYRRPDKLREYLQVLFKQENCLKQLANNYENVTANYHTLLRKPATKKEYQQMLAHVQVEIAKLTKKRQPKEAIERLKSAREIFEQLGNSQHKNYIKMLISEAEQIISRKKS